MDGLSVVIGVLRHGRERWKRDCGSCDYSRKMHTDATLLALRMEKGSREPKNVGDH